MPIHDWTRVDDGEFHALHTQWLARMTDAINEVLPKGYYALPEQKVNILSPDVTTYSRTGERGASNGVAVAVAEPATERRVAVRAAAVPPKRRLVIRKSPTKRVVAILELVSRGNKDRRDSVTDFATKVADFIRHEVHAVVIDVLPPGSHDPGGPHPEVWAQLDPEGDPGEPPPPGRPLTLAGYRAGFEAVAFLRYAAVGEPLPDVPLFLDGGAFVEVPLEATYNAVFARLPEELTEQLI